MIKDDVKRLKEICYKTIQNVKKIFSQRIEIFFITFLMILLICILSTHRIHTTNNKKDSSLAIEQYNVVLDVKSNNVVDVTENITVNFLNNSSHGIYKITPFWLEYTGNDNKTIKRKSMISNYWVNEFEKYRVVTKNGKSIIYIGDENSTTGIGKKKYTLKYTYDMGNDPYDGFDEFIFHAYGDYWKTDIKNASIQVNMPSSISNSKINFFIDKYRKNNVNDVVDYKVVNNTLYASFNEEKYYNKQLNNYCDKISKKGLKCNKDKFSNLYQPLDSALTVDIELPENYFGKGSYNYGFWSFSISIIIFIITCTIIVNWFKYGKDFKKVAQTVEFYPPDNLNAAEIGYIYNQKQNTKKLTIALIIQLASKGYIKIDELNDREKNIKITNLCYKCKLSKMKTPDIKSSLVPLSEMEKLVYKELLKNKKTIILSENKTFYEVFDKIKVKLDEKFKNKIYEEEANRQIGNASLKTIIILILSFVSYYKFEDLDPKLTILYVLSFLCVFISFIFTILMHRRTEYGQILYAKIKGFREFLLVTDKTQLEMLVDKYPDYFYDILPYTYVLNISKRWIRKFENITISRKDIGSFDYSSDSSYSELYRDIIHNYHISRLNDIIENSSSNNTDYFSGGDNSGGGCSSCGGGGAW